VIEPDAYRFCWITDFPFFERDEETGQIAFSTTRSRCRRAARGAETKDPLTIKASSNDIVCNGVELSSGAIRNHGRSDAAAFESGGYGPEEVERRLAACSRLSVRRAAARRPPRPASIASSCCSRASRNIREVIAFR
jgi:aspartyl-tRNA synthetase